MRGVEEKSVQPNDADSYESADSKHSHGELSELNQYQDEHDDAQADALQRRLNPRTRDDFKVQ